MSEAGGRQRVGGGSYLPSAYKDINPPIMVYGMGVLVVVVGELVGWKGVMADVGKQWLWLNEDWMLLEKLE